MIPAYSFSLKSNVASADIEVKKYLTATSGSPNVVYRPLDKIEDYSTSTLNTHFNIFLYVIVSLK